MTRDNLKKGNMHKPEDWIFCSENEFVHHIFFYCIVANQIWHEIPPLFKVEVGDGF